MSPMTRPWPQLSTVPSKLVRGGGTPQTNTSVNQIKNLHIIRLRQNELPLPPSLWEEPSKSHTPRK